MLAAEASSSEPFATAGAPARAVLATKLAIPVPAPTLVSRPRLTTRLRHHAAARLALVVAPAGSGKSSVVSQWCQACGAGRVAWLSLDPHDNEPIRFLLYLAAALGRVAPAVAEPVLALLQSPQPPPGDDFHPSLPWVSQHHNHLIQL